MKKTLILIVALSLLTASNAVLSHYHMQITSKKGGVVIKCESDCPKGIRKYRTIKRLADNFESFIQRRKFKSQKQISVHLGTSVLCSMRGEKHGGLASSFISEYGFINVCLEGDHKKIKSGASGFENEISYWQRELEPVRIIPPLKSPPMSTAHTPPLENNITIVCDDKCKKNFTPDQLEQISTKMSRDVTRLERAMRYAIPASRKPFEVHLMPDKACSARDDNAIAASTYIHETGKGVICFHMPPERIIAGESAIIHETAHHYFMYAGGSDIIEEIVISIPTLVEYPENIANKTCPAEWAEMYKIRYQLCKLGLTNIRVPELARIVSEALQKSKTGYISVGEFKKLLDNLLKTDTASVFALSNYDPSRP